MTGNRILALPLLDPGAGRVDLTVGEGLTIAQMVELALPGMMPGDSAQVRVLLVTQDGSSPVAAEHWARVRPRPGVQVVIRVIPAGDSLGGILSIVVAVAAVALAATFAPGLAAAWGVSTTTAAGLITAGVTVVGGLITNALVPPPSRPNNKTENRYTVSGWRNEIRPDGTIPALLGRIRYAPPLAAISYSEIVGDWQYLRAMFCAGYGEIELSEFRIGETSIEDYDEVEMEVRDGVEGDLPLSLFPRQILEENVGVELTRLRKRDDLGNIVDGDAEETPIVRTTGDDAAGASVILYWPAGLVHINDKGKKRLSDVVVRIEQRQKSADDWELVEQIQIVASKSEAFYRQHTWDLPYRARWQIRLTMISPENTDTRTQKRTVWAALQTLRPEYPLNFSKPLALIALRVKATHQLNGALDNFSFVGQRICLDWDAATGSWVRRPTRNPASLYRWVLQGEANPRPQTDDSLDLEALQEWHDYCLQKGLNYDRVLDDTDASLREVLVEVAAAGRATPRHDGLRWSVTVDRPQDLVIDHISPRNSWGFTSTRSYRKPPHGLRVTFNDEENDYKESHRIIPWIGHDGPVELTEMLDIPGKTNATEVAREVIRRMHEIALRPDTYEVRQDGHVRVASRGDLVRVSHDVLDHVQTAARVRAVSGFALELDAEVLIEAGERYSIRWRAFADEEDVIGQSVTAEVRGIAGWTRLVIADGPHLPPVGSNILFGRLHSESFAAIVREVEQGEDGTQILRLIDAAPEIDALTEATDIPPWSPRVGREIDQALIVPGVPRFVSFDSEPTGVASLYALSCQLVPAERGAVTLRYEVERRVSGGDWHPIAMSVASGGGSLGSFTRGTVVDVRACAVGAGGTRGPYTTTVAVPVAAGELPVPGPLDDDAVSIETTLGGAVVEVAVTDDLTTHLQVYRSTSEVIDREQDAVGQPIAVQAGKSWQVSIGDTTRTNLLADGGFNGSKDWEAGNGWTILDGAAVHEAGSAGGLATSVSLLSGRSYRIAYSVENYQAGRVRPQLDGGSDRVGSYVAAGGRFADRIQAVDGNVRFVLSADIDFTGRVDDVVLYLETGACLAQGEHHFWVEPQNGDGVPGPLAGPFSVIIT